MNPGISQCSDHTYAILRLNMKVWREVYEYYEESETHVVCTVEGCGCRNPESRARAVTASTDAVHDLGMCARVQVPSLHIREDDPNGSVEAPAFLQRKCAECQCLECSPEGLLPQACVVWKSDRVIKARKSVEPLRAACPAISHRCCTSSCRCRRRCCVRHGL